MKRKKQKQKRSARVLGFQNLVVDLYFFGRKNEKLFDITLPVLPFVDQAQTESRMMANAALAFSVLLNPDHPYVRECLIEALKLIVPEERATQFTDVLSETGREYGLNCDNAFLRLKIKQRNGKWLQVSTKVTRRSLINGRWTTIEKVTHRDFEIVSDQASAELGLDVVHANESTLPLLMDSAVGYAETLVGDLLLPKGPLSKDRINVPITGEYNDGSDSSSQNPSPGRISDPLEE